MNIRTLGSAVIAGFGLVALGTTTATAQKAGIGFGGSVGANVPNGEFGDGAKTGLVASGFVNLGADRFGLRGELFWSRSDLDSPFIRRVGNAVLPSSGFGEVSGDVNVVGASANVVVPITQSVIRPYLIGGVGVYRRRVAQDIEGTIEEFRSLRDSQTDVGYNGGAGIAIGAGGTTLFIEARYHSLQTSPERTRFVPLVIGVAF